MQTFCLRIVEPLSAVGINERMNPQGDSEAHRLHLTHDVLNVWKNLTGEFRRTVARLPRVINLKLPAVVVGFNFIRKSH